MSDGKPKDTAVDDLYFPYFSFVNCRGKQLMVDFRAEPTNPVIHVMHFGKQGGNIKS